jgi:hypothetical protein
MSRTRTYSVAKWFGERAIVFAFLAAYAALVTWVPISGRAWVVTGVFWIVVLFACAFVCAWHDTRNARNTQ